MIDKFFTNLEFLRKATNNTPQKTEVRVSSTSFSILNEKWFGKVLYVSAQKQRVILNFKIS